ncbi:MAG: hypothetical protein K2N72_03705 [Oscillospiraceae bacterium]|nr:hypothetical protein [Oscillospiraceae bacterium]
MGIFFIIISEKNINLIPEMIAQTPRNCAAVLTVIPLLPSSKIEEYPTAESPKKMQKILSTAIVKPNIIIVSPR